MVSQKPGEEAGDGLACDYQQCPALSAQRFIPDPWSKQSGARLYRSGDLVRFLGHNRLEFLNRIDQQVKLRGYRIELAEIEAVLLAVSGVDQAVVIPTQDHLVAYLTPCGYELFIDKLKTRLAEKLPAYMIPAFFVPLEELPLTPNGKLDRRALQAPNQATTSDSVAAPRDEQERIIAAIFAEVLARDEVCIHDSFFELGGHSLSAARATYKIQRALAVDLNLIDLFRELTVARLAVLARDRVGFRHNEILPLEPLIAAEPVAEQESDLTFSAEDLELLFD